MNRKIGFWVVLWAILVVVTGYLAFGYGPYDRAYGARGGWGHMRGWDNGYGPGMTGGYGMSGGAYGMMPFLPQNMTAEQAKQASQIQSEAEESSRNLTQQLLQAQAQMNSLYASDKRDWNAIRAAAKTVTDLQRQQMEATLDIQHKVDALLTDSQRQEVTRAWRGYGGQGGQ